MAMLPKERESRWSDNQLTGRRSLQRLFSAGCELAASNHPSPRAVDHSASTVTVSRLEALRKKLGWPEQGIDDYMRDQGIDSGTSRAKGYLSELGWRQGETQSYGEEDEY